jgi:hypothetical protein
MSKFNSAMAQQIAQAASDFDKRRTLSQVGKRGPE